MFELHDSAEVGEVSLFPSVCKLFWITCHLSLLSLNEPFKQAFSVDNSVHAFSIITLFVLLPCQNSLLIFWVLLYAFFHSNFNRLLMS
jgi:hypothetical protein